MLKTVVAAICQILISSSIAFAQPADSLLNEIGFELGPHIGYLHDLNFSPLNYRETGILLSLDYKRKSKNGNVLFTADVDYTSGKLRTDAGEFFTTDFYQGNIAVSVLFKVPKHGPGKLRLLAGPQYNSFFQYFQWGNGREAWSYLMAHGLNVKALAEYQLSGRKSLQSSLSVPVITNLVRPPYNGFDQYIVDHSENVVKLSFRGEPASFGKYVAVDWETKYRYDASEHIEFIIGYLLRYQRVSGANQLTQLQNQCTAGVTVKW